jgi:hypothetical protein
MRALVVPTIALLAIGGLAPGRLTLAVRIYALVACAAALVVALSALRRSYPRARPLRPAEMRKSSGRRPPPSLGRIEHAVALGVAGAFDLHFRLVPRIRAIARGLLAARRRLSLEADLDTARGILGDGAWGLVRPDRATPEDRLARGVPAAELRRVVESLERI